MRKRSTNLLLYLSQVNRVFSIDEVIKRYQISLRTLRSDLEEINHFLLSIDQTVFYIDDFGYIKNRAAININHLRHKLYSLNNYSYRCNQIERQLLIFSILINQQDYITMEFLAEKLYVSRITILSDIELLKEMLDDYSGIDLNSKSSKGIKLSIDNEIIFRRCFVDLLRHIIIKIEDENVFLKIVEREIGVKFSVANIIVVLRKFEIEQHILLSDESFYEITLYLFVVFHRHLQHYRLLENEQLNDYHDVNQFKDILIYCLCQLKIFIEPTEILSIAKGIQDNHIGITSQKIDDIELYKIVIYFLSNIATQFNVKLNEDHLLVDSLVIHIKNMFDDYNFDIDFLNEDGFQEKYWTILDDIDKNIVIVERYLMRTLSEKMKLSIFVHVCAALIREKRYNRRLNILVVCPGSMATGRFLEAQLNNYFTFRIIEVVAVDRVLKTIKDREEQIDFIVSTVDIKSDLCPVIIVEPILTSSDFNKIQSIITTICSKNENNEQNIHHSFLKPLVDLFDKLDKSNQNHFLADIEKVTNQYNSTIKHNANTNIAKMLGNSSNIKIVHQKIDWVNAIKQSGNILLMKNCITENYIDEMIQNINQYGPYIKVGKKIAIAHAKPEKYVYTEGLSLLLSKPGIFFDEDNENTINLMFCFSTMGNLEYIDLFWQIAGLGNDQHFIDLLLNSKNVDDAFQLIQQVSRSQTRKS